MRSTSHYTYSTHLHPTPSPWVGGVHPEGLLPVPVCVSGTRTFADFDFLYEKMEHLTYWFEWCELVVGSEGYKRDRASDWTGADYHARRWAGLNHYPQRIFFPEWGRYGPKAGPIRNSEMIHHLTLFPRRLFVAFHDGRSPGTADAIKKAKARLRKDEVHVFVYGG